MKSTMIYILVGLALTACGGSDKKPDYSELDQSKMEPGPLRQASANELTDLIKNGLRISLHQNKSANVMIRETMLANSADNVVGFSSTNLQVDGVDEADNVKYDGKYIYLATPTHTHDKPQSSLKIFSTDTTSHSVIPISETLLDINYWSGVSDMYLVNNEQGVTSALAMIRRSWNNIAFAENSDISSSVSFNIDNGIEISLYDVQTPSSPVKNWSMSIDGDLLGTRKIDNTLYIISSFSPNIPALNFDAKTTQEKKSNEALIVNVPVEKLLPEYSINSGTPQLLTDANGCMIPAETDKNTASLTLVNITVINLTTRQLVESVCVNGNVSGIYASKNNFYIGASDYSDWEDWKSYTVIHQFELVNGGVNYSATGSVEGTVSWDNPSFRMDEQDGYFRIVTSQMFEDGNQKHQLHILKKVEGRSEMEVIAQLPNSRRRDAIGKPGEDIYAVRFNGSKAYIVTFERIDPLYVLDLSAPTDPKIAGQLEVPGFSSYLHAVGDTYLFALGRETNNQGQSTGVKVSLYDIRNPSNPVELSKHIFDGRYSSSNALFDHHALSFLQKTNDQLRITLPISRYSDLPNNNYEWLNTGLHQFEINGLNHDMATLNYVGSLISEDSSEQKYPQWDNDRSFLHDDSIFYVHGDEVIASPWPSVE